MRIDDQSPPAICETWAPMVRALRMSIIDVADDEFYSGRVIWADSQWALQKSQHGLVRYSQTDFGRSLLPGMRVTVYYPGEGEQCCLVCRTFDDSEYKVAALRIVVMRVLGVIASHQTTDPLESFEIPEGRGRIKLSKHVTHEKVSCVCIDELQSDTPHKGGGRRMMEALCTAADEIETMLVLRITPIGNKYLSKEQLASFYEKFGFIKGSREWLTRAFKKC